MNSVANLYSWIKNGNNDESIKNLTDNKIIKVANEINSLIMETNIDNSEELTLPQIITVGCQSSGKSSLMNSLMRMDLLPTDSKMCTRTPLNIRLTQLPNDNNNSWIEFGSFKNNGWDIERKINLTFPIPLNEEINIVVKEIEKRTIELAGNGLDISSKPIFMKLYSNYVPNLTIIDLPGLTFVSRIDKKQPDDLKKKLEKIIISYMKNEKTIIMAVMQARVDLETDYGLFLIKKHCKKSQQIIGVLTKPDLMNDNTNIGCYLMNNISNSLQLSGGYYVVKNRSLNTMNILEGIEDEKQYFKNHLEYSKNIYKDKVGIKCLSVNLNKILVSSIKKNLSNTMVHLLKLETETNKKLVKLGRSIPISDDGKIIELNMYISSFVRKFIDAIESNGNMINIGYELKNNFVKYRQEINDIYPFKTKSNIYTKKYFDEIISSYQGNHMSCNVLPIKVIESCLTDITHRPIFTLRQKSIECSDNTSNIISNVIDEILKDYEFIRFPKLVEKIKSIIKDELVKLKIKCNKRIDDLLLIEEQYIWTDDIEFQTTFKKNINFLDNYTPDIMNKILESYFLTVKKTIQNDVPKIIMYQIVRYIQKNIQSYLYLHVISKNGVSLLKENDDVNEKRLYYTKLKKRIDNIKKELI